MVKANKRTQKKTRKPSAWNLFTMKLRKEHPEKSFSDILKLASKLKKQGVDYVKEVTNNASKKIRKTMKRTMKNTKKILKIKRSKKN
tara:strand:- start:1157 stop:1417 length:261 start_codon:yes stop_codon:yes gene_type:complete